METPVRALIIDDDEDMCALLTTILTRKLISCSCAHKLLDALKCMDEIHPDVIFLDNNLPDGSGVDFIPIIHEFDNNIKIVMITGDTINGLKEAAVDRGIFTFLPKPVTTDSIEKTVVALARPFITAFFPLLSVFSSFLELA